MAYRTIALLVAFAAGVAAQDYVGSQACTGCHRTHAEHFRRTPMGQSATPAARHLTLAPEKVTVRSEKFDRTFEVWAESGKLYQSESGSGFRVVYPLEYAVGSAMNGISFVVRRDDHLVQAPLSYYARTKSWALSPGYEFADYGFGRLIAPACIACHTGRPRPVAQQTGRYLDPPFSELAIGCENCHGPGGAHVKAKQKRGTIVNPAKLTRARADEICMNCHQNGDTRIAQPGRTELDFKPGTALTDTVAIFKVRRTAGAPRTDLLEHHESMQMSGCFEKSGSLSCLTCHNPHAATTDYNAKCLRCHTQPLAASHPPRTSDCIECHMPKRDIGFIAHSALTNHRIVRTPDQPGPPAPDGVELTHFNRVEGKPLPDLTLLQAYGQLLDQEPAFYDKFQELLDRVAKAEPANPLVLATLGRRSLRANRLEEAIGFLSKAVAQGSTASTTFEDLGDALSRAGRLPEAVEMLDRGIQLAPLTPVLYKSRALRLIKLQRFPEAKQTLERYVELFPEDDFVRKLLAQVSAGR